MKACMTFLAILVFTACCSEPCRAGTLNDFTQHVHQEVWEINELAASGRLPRAVNRLNMLNRYIEHQAGFELEELIHRARQENPSFRLNLDIELRSELTATYWQSRYNRAQRAYRNSREAMSGLSAMRTLDRQDVAWSYMVTTYEAVKTIKDVVESVGTQEYWDAFQTAREGVDGFIKNYEKIEEAHLQGQKTDLLEVEMKGLASRARRTIAGVEPVLSYMKANAEEGERFVRLLKRVRSMQAEAEGGKVLRMAFGDSRYTWNYEPFMKQVQDACADFREFEISCDAFKNSVEEVRKRARADWQRVAANIESSGDEDGKPKFRQWNREAWTDFLGVVTPMFRKTYDAECGEKTETASAPAGVTGASGGQPVVEARVRQDELAPRRERDREEPGEGSVETPETTVSSEAAPAELERVREVPPVAGLQTGDTPWWTRTIPVGTQRSWMGQGGEFHVRHVLGGRTVGYRRYADARLQYPMNEDVMDSLGVRHGPARQFGHDRERGVAWTRAVLFYRNNLKTGPEARFDLDGGITSVRYYIDDARVPEAEYRRRAAADPSLAPADIHREEKWFAVPREPLLSGLAAVAVASEVPWDQFAIPGDAEKFIKASSVKNPEGVRFTEFYYHPDLFGKVGEREWFLSGGGAVLEREVLVRGGREIHRAWDRSSGELRFFRVVLPMGKTGLDRKTVGPMLQQGRLESFGVDGRPCTVEQYAAQQAAHPGLPAAELMARLSARPAVAPGSHPAPRRVHGDIGLQRVPAGARLWRIIVHPGEISAEYVLGHRLVARLAWHDRGMTNPAYKGIYVHDRLVSEVRWFTDGSVRGVLFRGRIHKNGLDAVFAEDGSLQRYSYLGKKGSSIEYGKQAYRGIADIPAEDSHLHPGLKGGMHAPSVPASEMTPLLRAALGGKTVVANGRSAVVRRIEAPAGPAGEGEDDNYEQLQKAELFELLERINGSLEAADKSFDRPYWEEGAARTTLQPANPRQESLDILRRAVRIADRATYPENRGGLYHLLAYKLSDYAGRVFAFRAKQDFFGLAVELVLKADGLIPENRYMKDRLSEAYADSGAVWRELTRKALWGDHAYNKVFCDNMVIRQYERALQADPNNGQVRRILERLKAPRRPVPEAVLQFEEIEPEKWDEAQTLMARLDRDGLEVESPVPPGVHPLPVAQMTLSVETGQVNIRRAGTSKWVPVTERQVFIFPGDAIRTGPDAVGVSVSYTLDKAFLAIRPNAEVEFQGESTLLITRAGAQVQVTRKGSEFLVVTPTAAVGVRGTSFEVHVGADKTTETYLFEGVVETRTGTDIGYLVPGQKMVARKGGAGLEYGTFDVQARLQRQWAGLDQQRRDHERFRAAPGPDKGAPAPPGIFNPFAGKRQGGSARNATDRSVPPGSGLFNPFAAVRPGSGSSVPEPDQPVSFSWSPTGTYSSVMVNASFNYGPHNLIARLPVRVNRDTSVTINWFRDDQMISAGTHVIAGRSEVFDGQIVTGGEPLFPGMYRVEFVIDGAVWGQGGVEIRDPGRLDRSAAGQMYGNALQVMQEALGLVEQGDLYNAGIRASGVLPGLRQVLYSAPDLPDIQAAMELSMAMMSFTEMIHATETRQREQANEWVLRSLGHARRSDLLCRDVQLKMSTSKIVAALEAIFPDR